MVLVAGLEHGGVLLGLAEPQEEDHEGEDADHDGQGQEAGAFAGRVATPLDVLLGEPEDDGDGDGRERFGSGGGDGVTERSSAEVGDEARA